MDRAAGAYEFLPIENPEVRPVFFYPDSSPESQPIRYVLASAPRTFLGAAPVDPRTNHVTLIGAFAAPLRFLAPVLDDVVEFVQETPAR